MQCPVCAVESPADDRFCEACGAELAGTVTAAARCACGALASEVDEDGFCLRCGKKARVALPGDRIEVVLSAAFAGVSDRGLRHDRNEDRFGIVAEAGGFGLVVCDGVSATRSSEIASEAVTAGVIESLAEALRAGDATDVEEVMRAAVAAGSSRLAAKMNLDTRRSSASRKLRAKGEADNQAPSTTVVAALVLGSRVVVGWIGDSRAYWIDAGGVRQLTEDHSWQIQVVRAGVMSAEEAAKSPKAHAITRWIGADSLDDEAASVVTETLDGPGTLLLCTDGLWNYAATNEAMAELMASVAGLDAADAARELVRFALERGGVDNVTVAVLRAGLEPEQAGPRTLNTAKVEER